MSQRIAEIDIVIKSQKAEASLKSLNKSAENLEKKLEHSNKLSLNKLSAGAGSAKTSIDGLVGSSAGLSKISTIGKAANDHLVAVSKSAKATSNSLDKVGKSKALARVATDARGASTRVGGLFQKFSALKVLIAGGIIGTFATQLFDVAKQTDHYQAVLKTATGSMDLAKQKFAELNEFAATTPYTLQQSVEGFVKLQNLGLKPSEENMRSFGNTAAAMGKDLNQMVEAVADATTNEFERLKEFGIKSKKEGENVTFTFQGVATTVKASSEGIQKYLVDLGNTKFAGAMSDQMETLGGKLSNLKQNFDNLLRTIGGSSAFKATIDGLSGLLGDITDYINSGALEADFSTWSEFIDDIGDIYDNTVSLLEVFNLLDGRVEESLFTIKDIFLDFPVWAKAAFDNIVAHGKYGIDWLYHNFQILDLKLGKVWTKM